MPAPGAAAAVKALFGSFTQESRLLQLTTPAGPNQLLAESVRAVEGISEGFALHITALSTDARIPLKSLIGQPVLLELLTARSGVRRPFHGHVTRIEMSGANGGFARYRLTVEPWTSFLAHTRDSRIFQDASVVDIIDTVFARYQCKWKLTPAWRFELRERAAHPRRSHTTQYQESDLAFVQRLMAEEGLFYFFRHTGECHELVIADHNGAFAPNAQDTIRFTQPGAVMKEDSIDRWCSAVPRNTIATTSVRKNHMTIFELFTARWSAHSMTEDDRRKIFWYLMRKTSYTAWRRLSDSFDRFAAIFERQVREEPVSVNPDACFDCDWGSRFAEVLEAQVLYEKGLARLGMGDRTVWLYNERGILDDANVLAGEWYVELVNHGMRGDHIYHGKYLNELTEAIKQFSLACRDTASIVQPMMAETPAPEIWSTFWEAQFMQLPVPAQLPKVPVPNTELTLKTGEIAPVFGIYEPQIKDGCMNYLLGSVAAPTMWESDGTYATDRKLSFVWRLIWEDTRYRDGQIPAEEASYFPDEELFVTDTPKDRLLKDDLLSARSEESCPRSGEWAVMDDLGAKLKLRKGEKIPRYQGRGAEWVWLRK